MKKMKAGFLAIFVMAVSGPALACFKSGEQVSGMNKVCYYKCIEGTRAITISAVELCPLSL